MHVLNINVIISEVARNVVRIAHPSKASRTNRNGALDGDLLAQTVARW
jgi:hypothetical protein